MTRRFFEKNSMYLGIMLGTFTPAITLGVLYVFIIIIPEIFFQKSQILKTSTLFLVSIIPNALLMRYYLLKLQLDKTGRGILLMTFVYIITYFIALKIL